MAITIERQRGLIRESDEQFGLECPYCGVYAHMSPESVPEFDKIATARPKHVGLVYLCDACRAPVFLRFAVKEFRDNEIELYRNFIELERPKERFQYSYLPADTARLLREAFGCYAADLRLAFAVLCRKCIASAVQSESMSNPSAFEQLFHDASELAELRPDTRAMLQAALFGSEAEPELDADQAAILVEIVKDMFQQRFVRTAKLRRAIEMRRFFASAESDANVTPIAPLPPRANSSSSCSDGRRSQTAPNVRRRMARYCSR